MTLLRRVRRWLEAATRPPERPADAGWTKSPVTVPEGRRGALTRFRGGDTVDHECGHPCASGVECFRQHPYVPESER